MEDEKRSGLTREIHLIGQNVEELEKQISHHHEMIAPFLRDLPPEAARDVACDDKVVKEGGVCSLADSLRGINRSLSRHVDLLNEITKRVDL